MHGCATAFSLRHIPTRRRGVACSSPAPASSKMHATKCGGTVMHFESGTRKGIARASCFLIFWCVMASAHAASVYRCVDSQGHLAYRDTPCAAHAQQRKVDLQPLPTIGDAAEVAAASHRKEAAQKRHGSSSARSRRAPPRRELAKAETSWECRAADGEVFYRHARCPGSVPGDGTVRSDYAGKTKSSRTRSRQGAWSRVSVHGTKITRVEACRRIHSAGAAGRDGHARDETVSTYDHLMGRDPCSGE